MKFGNRALAAVFVGIGMGPAFADVVRMDALPYHGLSPTPPAGVDNQIVPDWNGSFRARGVPGGLKATLAYDHSVTFTVTADDAGVWTFRTGIDFRRGGTLILNGNVWRTQARDSSGNDGYSNPSQFQQWSIDLAPGTYTLDVYGENNCCDGGAAFEDFKTTSGAVPEISTWAMLLAGFASLGFAGHARKKNELAA